MSKPELQKDAIADGLRAEIVAVLELREAVARDSQFAGRLASLKSWQAERLSGTYSDLLASERYRPATTFFLSDLYGPKDFRSRDGELARVIPAMCRMLPVGALQTIWSAVRLDRLSEGLDQAVAVALQKARVPADGIDEASYGAAYRAVGRRPEREEQINLIGEIGVTLDALTRSRSLRAALVLMRKPAKVAGFGELQDFLERGFEAFRHMHGAKEFMEAVLGRERAVMNRLFEGKARPFDVERSPLPV
jgi:hypothetical protein